MPGELNLGTVYASFDLRLTKLEKGLSDATAKFDATGKKMEARSQSMARNVGQSMETLGRTFSMAVSAPLLGLGIAAVKAATQMDSLKRGLVAVSGSSVEAERQLKRLNEVAKLPGLGLKEAIQGSINLQAAGFSAKQAERSLMAFGNALATVGKGKDALAAVNVQLTQMANKQGAIGEDIRALASWVPQLRTAMMHAFGTADTEAISKAGVTGKQVVQALTAELEKLPTVTGGIQNSFENLSDQLWKSLGELGKTLLPAVGRAADDLTGKLKVAADWWKHLSSGMQDAILKGAVGLIGVGGLTFALGKVIGMVALAIEAFNKLRTAIISAAAVGAAAPGAAAGGAARGGAAGLLSRFGGGPGALAAGTAYGLWQSLTNPGYLQRFGQGMGTFGTPPLGATAGPGANLAPFAQPPANVFHPFGIGVRVQPLPPPDPVAAALRAKVAAALGASEARNAARAGRRAATAQRQAASNQQRMTDALGLGWYDPEQVLGQYQGWQKQGIGEQMGLGLTSGIQGLVSAMQSILARVQTTQFGGMVSEGLAGAQGLVGRGFGLARNLRYEQNYGTMTKGLMGSLQGTFGGMMGAPATGMAAAQNQVLGWMQQAFGEGGPMWDQAKLKSRMKRGFDFMQDLAYNLSDEFASSFGQGLERAFGRNPFGKALARSLSRLLGSVMDQWMMAGVQTEGEGGKGVNVGALLGKIGLTAALGGIGSLFGGLFQEGGTVPGPPGKAKFAVVHGGEVVLTRQQQVAAAGAGGITVNLGGVTIANRMDAASVGREIAWQIQQRMRTLPGG